MNTDKLNQAVEIFMHPSIFTGVKPLFLVAEELVTQKKLGLITGAVWLSVDSEQDFSYINKFAVKGKINLTKYHQEHERLPFHGRVALANEENLKKTALHQDTLASITELQIKRSELLNSVSRGFTSFLEVLGDDKEVYLFKRKDGDWEKELFSHFDIQTPYKYLEILEEKEHLKLRLENTKTSYVGDYLVSNDFYGFFEGSKADIAGLIMKNESYLKSIETLKTQARESILSIEWLSLESSVVKSMTSKLAKHPFEEYFKYVEKHNVRKVDVLEKSLELLKGIVLKYMPETDTPMGIQYISIDKLLHLFHAVIPRAEALKALEACDIVYEPPAMLLGYVGKHNLAPKFLVSLEQVASVYEQFESFKDACKQFEKELLTKNSS